MLGKGKNSPLRRKETDMSAANMNADPTAKSKKGKDKATYEAEKARIARAAIELELEAIDATPERLKLFKRMTADGACKCDACCKRRLWIAIRRVDKKQEELDMLDAMDNMVANAYQGETEAVIEGLKKFGMAGVFHQGGPIAVTGCEECKYAPPEEPCYHCGRAGWMPSKKELIISRKDLKTMPAYFVMPVLHAACWGGHVLLAMKLIKMGCPVSEQDDMGCSPLHWVVCQGHKNVRKQERYIHIADALLLAKADVTVMDAALKLPLELTTHPNPPFLPMKMTILKHAKADLNTSLLKHCRTGDVALARRTLAAGADLQCSDWLNDTPLHVAITYGHKELIDMLVDLAETQHRLVELVHTKSVDGLDCFAVAEKWGYKNISLLLKAYVEKARITELANDAVKGGLKDVPLHLRGTLLGQKVAEEIKKRSTLQAKITKRLRMEQKQEKREARRAAQRAGLNADGSGQASKSQVCVVS